MAVETHTCIHEEQIQDHSIQIKGLETRSHYKEQRIDELYDKMDKMDEKIDVLNDNVNKLILQSSQDDKNLEVRLTKIETDMENQKQESQRRVTWIGIGLTILTIMINVYFQMMH
ncbi:MAG: hypothetical protein IJH65_10170 [Methanobrevibacter sp.]|nr:hypothetical protein [Methanobrevibacter sp.]